MARAARLTALLLGCFLILAMGGAAAWATDGAKATQENWTAWSYMPENINFAYGQKTDYLYFVIMVLVASIFFLTEGLLLWFMWKYRARAGHKATYVHGSNTLEVIWTVIPALILIWLAFAQRGTWAEIKQDFPAEKDAVVIQAFPEQFQWNFRYPGADEKFGTKDDITTVNVLTIPVDRKILIKMTSKDVIHSFFLPNLRVKQDVVPGMLTKVWFVANRIPVWDLKKQQMVFITDAEFKAKRIGFGSTWRWTSAVAEGDTTNQRKLSYEKNPKKPTGTVLAGGKVEKEQAFESVDYVLHRCEVACAELCGLGHTKMRAMLNILPADRYAAWIEEASEEAAAGAEKWTTIWDKFHPDYNADPATAAVAPHGK
ncbi:MAG: hypothetical protein HZA54_12780 [Planctomycetes bacterium]|nr:hypothetical protein [Planctomycetota bacterium]